MLTAEVNYPLIDIGKTTQKLHEEMSRFLIDTMSIWVTGATDPVPVWSGAARASFLKIAQEARTQIEINPVVASRIPLGIEESKGEVFANPGKDYGWLWESRLVHIGIVDARVNFVDEGLKSIERRSPELPDLVFVK